MTTSIPALRVVEPGALTTVQDLGRHGVGHLGVSPSGAADRRSLRLANRLVGNPAGAAALEVTLGGLAVVAGIDVVVAVTGMTVPVSVAGRPAGRNAPLRVAAGEDVRIGTGSRGLRAYLAVRGGVAVPVVLGSRSADLLGGLGPAPLAAGDVVAVGPPPPDWPVVDVAPVPPVLPDDPDGVVLRAVPGPHVDRLGSRGLDVLTRPTWRVGADSNRTALRLEGQTLPTEGAEVAPVGLVRGAVQLPPAGRPVLMLADHPVTGGYPVVAVVLDDDTDLAGQLRPGDALRLSAASATTG